MNFVKKILKSVQYSSWSSSLGSLCFSQMWDLASQSCVLFLNILENINMMNDENFIFKVYRDIHDFCFIDNKQPGRDG